MRIEVLTAVGRHKVSHVVDQGWLNITTFLIGNKSRDSSGFAVNGVTASMSFCCSAEQIICRLNDDARYANFIQCK